MTLEQDALECARTSERERIRATFAKLDCALHDGRITTAEYEYYIAQRFGGKRERELLSTLEAPIRERHEDALQQDPRQAPPLAQTIPLPPTARGPQLFAVILLLTLIVAGMGGILLFGTQSPSGYIVYDAMPHSVQGFTAHESVRFVLNETNTSALRIAGVLSNGSANVTLVLENGTSYLVWNGSAEPAPDELTTAMSSYASGSNVTAIIMPADAQATLWLTNPAGEQYPIDASFVVTSPGTYTLDAIVNASTVVRLSTSFEVRSDNESALDVLRSQTLPALAFTDACAQTCQIPATEQSPLAIDVALSSGASIDISSVTLEQPRRNQAPVQRASIPNIQVLEGASAVLDLSAYFEDPDGDALAYDVMNAPGVNLTIAGSTLTIEGMNPGTTTSRVYASDAVTLVSSNSFGIDVIAADAQNATPPRQNETTNSSHVSPPVGSEPAPADANSTSVTTANTAQSGNATGNETVPLALCDAPDPNLRPIECLQEHAAEYFQPQSLYLTTTDRVPIARLTPIGNLLIRGDVIEHAVFTARDGDYRIGYENVTGGFVTTIWFDSVSGDLRLAGSLHEENANNAPPAGAFVLRNKRGVVLAWADVASGTLYVRGNLIAGRRSVEE